MTLSDQNNGASKMPLFTVTFKTVDHSIEDEYCIPEEQLILEAASESDAIDVFVLVMENEPFELIDVELLTALRSETY